MISAGARQVLEDVINTTPPDATTYMQAIARRHQIASKWNRFLQRYPHLLGLPSIGVPVELVEGLPQGVQIVSSRYRDALCLDAAERIEQAQGVFTPIDPW